jgi:ATP-dependent Clp protease protease subunit
MGHAQSAGALLLSHGDIRCVAPHSRIMVHEVSAGTIGNVNDMHTEVNEIKRLNEYWMNWLAENCGKTLKELKNFFGNHRREVYLNAQGAIDFGIADKIGIPFLSTQNVKNYEVSFLETKPPVALPKPTKKKSKK